MDTPGDRIRADAARQRVRFTPSRVWWGEWEECANGGASGSAPIAELDGEPNGTAATPPAHDVR